MIIKKIIFDNWQVIKSALLNVGFTPLALVKNEEIDVGYEQQIFLGGIKESFRAVSIDKNFEIFEKELPKEIKKISQLNDYFIKNFSNKNRMELLQCGKYQKLNLQIGDLENITVESNGKKYHLTKANKSGTKWQIVVDNEIFTFKGFDPYGGILHDKYIIIYDDIDNYTERQKLAWKKEKENLGGSVMMIID